MFGKSLVVATVVERWEYVVVFCSEEIVMWHCGIEVEVACNDVLPMGRESFGLNSHFCNEKVNLSCEYFW